LPNDKKIDYIEMPASDMDVIEAFYSKTFGWKFTDYGPEYRAFNDGQLDGGFYRSDLRSTTEGGAALVVMYSKNLEATERAVLEHGGVIAKETFEFPGGRRFQFFDPHGNELAVWSDQS